MKQGPPRYKCQPHDCFFTIYSEIVFDHGCDIVVVTFCNMSCVLVQNCQHLKVTLLELYYWHCIGNVECQVKLCLMRFEVLTELDIEDRVF